MLNHIRNFPAPHERTACLIAIGSSGRSDPRVLSDAMPDNS
jgi:hypothetical protein